jgi:hypothetical protein
MPIYTPEVEVITTKQTSQEQEVYQIVCVENIRKTFESMRKCKNGKIITCEDASKRAELSSSDYFECTECKQRVDMDISKPGGGKACYVDVNRRTNLSLGDLGLGRGPCANIWEIFNLPHPVSCVLTKNTINR